MIPKIHLVAAGLLFAATTAFASPIAVGALQYQDLGNGTAGFTVLNLTGANNGGCDAVDGFPVCGPVGFQNSTLTVMFVDSSQVTTTITRTPVFTFTDSAYLYGDPGHVNDDPNQSFVFDITSQTLVSATFTGTLTQSSLAIDDGAGHLNTLYSSDGTVSGTVDLNSPDGIGLLNTNDAAVVVSDTPEPASFLLLSVPLAAFFVKRRIRPATHQ